MAVAFIQEFPIEPGGDRATTNYDAVNAKLTTNQEAPDGLIVHYAGFDEDAGVFRIVNVWESKEQGQAYLEQKVMPAVREVIGDDVVAARPPSREGWYELHHVAGV
jgi:hypothetical protein